MGNTLSFISLSFIENQHGSGLWLSVSMALNLEEYAQKLVFNAGKSIEIDRSNFFWFCLSQKLYLGNTW